MVNDGKKGRGEERDFKIVEAEEQRGGSRQQAICAQTLTEGNERGKREEDGDLRLFLNIF